ncbi:MAG: hypothetical protein GYB68_01655, partial [Chloroflexi bacterium]|nr:hypothetical protein [Chloroflexota bacterium]
LRQRSGHWLWISGILFGLAQATKFSALLLAPTIGLITLWFASKRPERQLIRAAAAGRIAERLGKGSFGWIGWSVWVCGLMVVISLPVLWASQLFSLRPLIIEEFLHFLSLTATGHNGYLLGRFSADGWWSYHLVALAVKLPEPTLLLILLTALSGFLRPFRLEEALILFAGLFYLGITLLISLNVGLRYLLPILPLAFLLVGRLAALPLPSTRWRALRPVALTAAVMAALLINLSIFPHYLAYFNLLSGGPDQGYRWLADSNIDWGQDLPGAAAYQHAHDLDKLYLSYFGQAAPIAYGLEAIALPGWPPPPDPRWRDFAPLNPEPGVYIVGVSNLVGTQLFEPDSFGAFLAREPVDQIGHSMHVYEMAPPPSPIGHWAVQCVDHPVETEERLRVLTGLSDVQVIYVDCAHGLPAYEGTGWLLLPIAIDPPLDLGPPFFLGRYPDGRPHYHAWRLDQLPQPAQPMEGAGIQDALALLGYQIDVDRLRADETIELTVWWQVVDVPPPPVSLFAHLLDEAGQLRSAGDALSIPVEHWEPGMVFVQRHRFDLPSDLPNGTYRIVTGLYSLESGERFGALDGTTEIELLRVSAGSSQP